MRRQESPKERMQRILDVIGISANEFENRCGLGHGFVSRLTAHVSKRTRAKVKAVYPTLNFEYVTHSKGDMFCSEPKPKESVKERIAQFADYMNITEKELLNRAGLSPAFITNMSDNIRKSSAEKFVLAFPKLSQEWLLFGTGKMILDKAEKKEDSTVLERIKQVVKYLGTTVSTFEAETGISSVTARDVSNISKAQVHKITKRYPFINPVWLMSGTGTMIAEPPKLSIATIAYAPLVTQRAYAGYLSGYADEEYLESLDKVPYILNSETRGNIIAVEVSGDSMDNGTSEAYKDKDIVLCKEFTITDSTIPYKHYDFVIVHKEGLLIKRVTDFNKEQGTMVIHSLNKFYGDVTISLEDVRKLFIVVMKISSQKR